MRRQLSIKLRITLWFAVFMLLLACMAAGFILVSGEAMMVKDTEGELKRAVEENAGELWLTDGEMVIGEGFAFYHNGIYTIIYDHKGVYLAGQIPVGVTLTEPLADGQLLQKSPDERNYYLYDRQVQLSGETYVWLRGVALDDGVVNFAGVMARFMLAALPILLLLAVAGGYLLAWRALAPVERIGQAAASINEGRDLSARIDLPAGEDEVHRLAATFDSMFGRLERSFEAEKQFTANASHELRTPVAVILAQCDALADSAETVEDYQQGVAVIKRQAAKMSYLVGQLLSLSRIDRGVAKANFEETDLSELVQVICAQQAQVLGRVTITCDAAPGLLAWVDAGLVARALENLLENADKYGRADGQAWVTLTDGGDELLLAVRDDGPGIAPEALPRVWERFYQADASRSQDGGMGLGLAIVREIVRLHGGWVRAESQPGQGCVFTLAFSKNPPKNEAL